jgi:signal peptidase I
MDFDFELIITILVLVAFAAWVFHKLFQPEETEGVIHFAQSLFGVLLLVFVLRSFVFEPFKIPSSSMRPTLAIGDFVLVNKFVYGLKIPVWNKRIIEFADPKRGDIIVFKPPVPAGQPENPRYLKYIKRVVGVPGDTVEGKQGRLYINGTLSETALLGSKQWYNDECFSRTSKIYEEDMSGVSHSIMKHYGFTHPADSFGPITVPDGHYFFMGDNRDFSKDSRFIGMVAKDDIDGKAQLIWMNLDLNGYSWGDVFKEIVTLGFADIETCAKGWQFDRIGGIESNAKRTD